MLSRDRTLCYGAQTQGETGMECAKARETVRHETPSVVLLTAHVDEDSAVAAYQETPHPAVILARKTLHRPADENQRMEFEKVEFREHRGYSVWCCEIVDDELRVALSKERP